MISGQQTEYICDNPFCNMVHSLNDVQKQADDKGVIFAHGGQKIFQVVECRNSECRRQIVFCCDADKPVIDMRKLILIPHQFSISNAKEQIWLLQNRDTWHDYLKFQFIPAWDKTVISEKEFMEFDNHDPSSTSGVATLEIDTGYTDCGTTDFDFTPFLTPPDIPLSVSEQEFYDQLNQEKTTGQISCKSACNNDPLLSKSAWKIDPPQQSLYSVDFIRQIGGTGDAYSGNHQKDTFSLISRQEVHTSDCKRVQFIQKYRP